MIDWRRTPVILALLFCALAVVGTLLTSAHSLVSLAVYYLLFSLGMRLLDPGHDRALANATFFFYAVGVLLIFHGQLIGLPQYYGFSGGLGVGTDDSFFYSLGAPVLPADFPLRPGYAVNLHPYGFLMRFFSEPMYALYRGFHPLDLLYMNAAGLAFTPFLTRAATRILTSDESASRAAFVLALLCPFTLANGLILVRDGLLATCFAGALYAVLSTRPILLVFFLFGTAFLRLPAAILLMASIWFIVMFGRVPFQTLAGWPLRHRWLWLASLLVVPVVTAVGLYVAAGDLIQSRLMAVQGLFRDQFLSEFVFDQSQRDQGTATFYAINQLALPIRLPLAFLFYFGAPFLAVDTLTVHGALIPRQVMLGAYAILFIAYAGWFVRGLVRALDERNRAILALAIIFCLDLLILSQASMQIRHKVELMPLMYVIVAYGWRYRQRDAVIIGLAVSAGVALMELLSNSYKLWLT
jgi:hypothetical protein